MRLQIAILTSFCAIAISVDGIIIGEATSHRKEFALQAASEISLKNLLVAASHRRELALEVASEISLTNLRTEDVTLNPTVLAYVNSPEFERKCTEIALERAASSSDESSDKEDDLWSSSDENDSSATTVDVDPHAPSRLEQLLSKNSRAQAHMERF